MNDFVKFVKEYEQLQKENKKLKEQVEHQREYIEDLKEENRELIGSKKRTIGLLKEVSQLKEQLKNNVPEIQPSKRNAKVQETLACFSSFGFKQVYHDNKKCKFYSFTLEVDGETRHCPIYLENHNLDEKTKQGYLTSVKMDKTNKLFPEKNYTYLNDVYSDYVDLWKSGNQYGRAPKHLRKYKDTFNMSSANIHLFVKRIKQLMSQNQ